MIKTEDDFWKLMADGQKSVGNEELREFLIEKLSRTSDEMIIRFVDTLQELMTKSYDNKLWAASFLINGDTTEENFEYFRCRLIAEGKEVFYKALADPDSLADLPALIAADNDEFFEFEDLRYVGVYAYMKKHNTLDSDDVEDDYYLAEGDYELTGEDWTEDDLPQLLPKLCKLFDFQP